MKLLSWGICGGDVSKEGLREGGPRPLTFIGRPEGVARCGETAVACTLGYLSTARRIWQQTPLSHPLPLADELQQAPMAAPTFEPLRRLFTGCARAIVMMEGAGRDATSNADTQLDPNHG